MGLFRSSRLYLRRPFPTALCALCLPLLCHPQKDHQHRGGVVTVVNEKPVALAVYKRGKWCIVGKIVKVDGVWVLLVVHRHQVGTKECISLPKEVLDVARRRRCQWLYYCHDRPPKFARRLPLDLVTMVGWFQPSDGEWYVPLRKMDEVAYPKRWEYAKTVLKLGSVVISSKSSSAMPKTSKNS